MLTVTGERREQGTPATELIKMLRSQEPFLGCRLATHPLFLNVSFQSVQIVVAPVSKDLAPFEISSTKHSDPHRHYAPGNI